MEKEKKDTILGISIVFILSMMVLIIVLIVVFHNKKEEPHSHYYIAVPVYVAEKIENKDAGYLGLDLSDTYEIVIEGRKYKGKLGDVYFCTEYRNNVCDYICEDNTIIRFLCGTNELELLSIEFGTPANMFQDNSKEYIKNRIMNYIRENDKQYIFGEIKNKQYVFDVINDDKYINYSYTRYISGVETLEGINLVMDENGLVYKISRYVLHGNYNEIDLTCMSDSDESLREKLEEEYGGNVKYEIIKKQIGLVSIPDVAINYHIRINDGSEVEKYQVVWGMKLEGDGEIGEKCS